MGGKAAMQLGLTRPDLIRRMVVADIAPVAYSHDQSRNARAMADIDLSQITTRAEADAALARSIDDPALRAFYYARAIEIPTPRWTAYDRVKFNLDLPEDIPLTAQERAYSSPIWFDPEG